MPTCFEALMEQGREQGREQGWLLGRIRTLQEVLRQPLTPQQTLSNLSPQERQSLAVQLQELLESTSPPAR